ncbi:MAG TPA: glycine cleavage system protein GcvH [Bacteroidales bacterium]|jgi:glycine cleavage system H protein|nr:glycine cleavage system protein GcvH [Bacteroidales bacterium]MDD3891900.1 glycine cleavage system protein GcvH [Bacteroidales bacterium]HCX98752.1 glycine cleavage system protein GcvH [Bacteroidales bacterium]
MNIPENLKYTKDHEWVRVEGNEVVVGITDFAQDQLGDVVFVEIETEGETLDKEEVFGTIEAVKTVSDVFMPVSGKVTAFNEKLADTPEIMNKDPYGDGWMIRIEMSNTDELKELITAKEYEEIAKA